MNFEKGEEVCYYNEHGSLTRRCIVVDYDSKNERYILENPKGKQIYIDADRVVKEGK